MNDIVKVAFVEYSAKCLGEFLAREKLAGKKTKLTRTSMKCALDMGAVPPPPNPGAQQAGGWKFDKNKFFSAAKADMGPALGSIVGAGLANAYDINPIAGAAAGYGVGAIPEIISSIRHRGMPVTH